MPLLLSKQININSAYAVWNIQETNEQLIQLVGHDVPSDLNPKRFAEWMVGRILVKSLCAQFGITYQGLQPNEAGKPYLIGHNAEISISHSFPMAAAMIHLHHPCGIDLERTRHKLVDIQHKFINENELAFQGNVNRLCAIWCGKEVLYKIYGRRKLSMKDETTIRFLSDSIMHGSIHKEELPVQEYQIHYEPVRDYFLAYSL